MNLSESKEEKELLLMSSMSQDDPFEDEATIKVDKTVSQKSETASGCEVLGPKNNSSTSHSKETNSCQDDEIIEDFTDMVHYDTRL